MSDDHCATVIEAQQGCLLNAATWREHAASAEDPGRRRAFLAMAEAAEASAARLEKDVAAAVVDRMLNGA